MSEELKFEDEVGALMKAEPFVPFTLILANGGRHEVIESGYSFFGKNVVYIIQPTTKGLAIFRPSQIVGVERHEQANA